jgi:hypothetical protein
MRTCELVDAGIDASGNCRLRGDAIVSPKPSTAPTAGTRRMCTRSHTTASDSLRRREGVCQWSTDVLVYCRSQVTHTCISRGQFTLSLSSSTSTFVMIMGDYRCPRSASLCSNIHRSSSTPFSNPRNFANRFLTMSAGQSHRTSIGVRTLPFAISFC